MTGRFGKAFTDRPPEKISKFMDEFQRLKHNFNIRDRITEPISLKLPGLNPKKIDSSLYDFDEDQVLVSWSVGAQACRTSSTLIDDSMEQE